MNALPSLSPQAFTLDPADLAHSPSPRSRLHLPPTDPLTRRRLPQRHRTQQIVRQRLPQQHRQHLQPTPHTHLIQTTLPCPRVDPLRRTGTLAVDRLRLCRPHALTPQRHTLLIPRSRGKLVHAPLPLLLLFLFWRYYLHRMVLMHCCSVETVYFLAARSIRLCVSTRR